MCKENKKFEKKCNLSQPSCISRKHLQNEQHLSSLDHIQWRQISYQEKKRKGLTPAIQIVNMSTEKFHASYLNI